jgi:predicted Zn finger-like uncharacterized protein
MAQSSLQTHCPKCDTRFRVTDAQLSVAKGKVRCGNCMSVFNAIEHKIEEASAPSTASEKKSGPEAHTHSPHQDSEDDLLFADNPEEDAAESTYTGTRLTFTDDELSDSFRSVDEKSKGMGFATDDDEEPGESVDESWAEDMLSDDKEPERAPEPEAKPEPKAQPEPAPPPEPEADTQPKPAPEKTKEPEDDYDGFFIDEPEPSSWDYEEPSSFGYAEPSSFGYAESSSFGYEEPSSFGHEKPSSLGNEEPRSGPSKSESPYHNLRREPVAVSGNSSGRLRGFLWFLVILALLGGLVSQVVWYQFDRLSAIPQLRPFYVQSCEMFGCELKPLVNVQSIQSRKLVVKTNAENRSQLIVDAVIINRASFEQPFPAIALTFSNLNNDVVAQSVFTPEEYLAGDGQGLKAMPTDTPVRILINIRDPGKDAVNYNIAFRAHTP